jgi:hypothetical protein
MVRAALVRLVDRFVAIPLKDIPVKPFTAAAKVGLFSGPTGLVVAVAASSSSSSSSSSSASSSIESGGNTMDDTRDSGMEDVERESSEDADRWLVGLETFVAWEAMYRCACVPAYVHLACVHGRRACSQPLSSAICRLVSVALYRLFA